MSLATCKHYASNATEEKVQKHSDKLARARATWPDMRLLDSATIGTGMWWCEACGMSHERAGAVVMTVELSEENGTAILRENTELRAEVQRQDCVIVERTEEALELQSVIADQARKINDARKIIGLDHGADCPPGCMGRYWLAANAPEAEQERTIIDAFADGM